MHNTGGKPRKENMYTYDDSTKERILRHVIIDNGNDHWIVNKSYRCARYRNTFMSTKRLVLLLYKGEYEENNYVISTCGVDACINPNHIKYHTNKVKVSKPRIPPRGSLSVNAKLNEDSVRKIRYLHSNGIKQSELAKMFGVHYSLISRIVAPNSKRWR